MNFPFTVYINAGSITITFHTWNLLGSIPIFLGQVLFCGVQKPLISLAFADEIRAEEDDCRDEDNHRAGRRRVEIGEEQADNAREQPEQQGVAVIPAHIAGDIARRRGGENEHRVDEKQAHNADGEHHRHGGDDHKEVVVKPHGDAFTAGEGGGNGDRVEAVEAEKPHGDHRHERAAEHPQVGCGDVQDIAD